nr:MAG TPA: tail tape measure protein [Caudoviricetes sp.]
MGYDGSLKFDTEINEKGFSAGVGKIGSIAQTALGVFSGQMMTRAVDGIVSLGKAALDSKASLEQNLGGVETLFKENAQAVIDNANKAYKTAGMSANAYMESVTSFSASLLQSVAGDTEKAANIADMAMVDMSDNANKMGTSMELIQNAYQGFAKQNYTMLDNLKLGYGGTKEEMQRLLEDAEKISGVKYDISNLSDVYNAIHVIQGELGITGTTAKEASSTISGSIDSAKAAFDNFLNGSGSPAELADAMVTAGRNILNGLAEIIPRLIETIPETVRLIKESFAEQLSPENLQEMLDSGVNILMSILNGVLAALPGVIDTALMIVQTLAEYLIENFPKFLEVGAQLLQNIITGITQGIPRLLAQGADMLSQYKGKIIEYLPKLIDSGLKMLVSLLNGLLQAAPKIIEQAGRMLTEYVDIIIKMLPKILESGKNMILSLLQGLVQNAPKIIAQIAKTLADFLATIASNLPEFLRAGIEIIGELLSGIISAVPDIIAAIPGMLSDIGSAFLDKDWGAIGWNIIEGIKNGVMNAAGNLVNAAVNAARNAVDTVKGWLGIASPSKRMRDEVGKMMALGTGIGFEENIPVNDMKESMKEAVGKVSSAVDAKESDNANIWFGNNDITDGSGNSDDGTPIVINNTFEVDGTPLVKKTTKAVIKKVENDQKDKQRARGK